MPSSRRRVYLRRRIAVLTAALVALALLFYLPLTLLAPLHAVEPRHTVYSAPMTASTTLDLPGYGASAIAAIGYPGLLASGGSSAPLPIASITKIITALVVLQSKPLTPGEQGPSIPFTAADQAILKSYAARDGDVYPIQVGGSMSELDVLTVALVASANNYARALADWAFGSEANFLPVANAWLKTNGMTSTTLTDSIGLNYQNTSTPSDLITLGRLALANPVVSTLVDTKTTTMPVVGTIKNTNGLLGKAGIDGIKTGTLAQSSLLFSSRLVLGGHVVTLIGVVLDGPDHPTIDAAIHTLVKTARAGFHLVTLAKKGQSFASYQTIWGASANAVTTRSASVVVWGGTRVTSSTAARPIALGRKGAIIGSVSFTAGPQKLTVPLGLSRTLSDPGAGWRLVNPTKLF